MLKGILIIIINLYHNRHRYLSNDIIFVEGNINNYNQTLSSYFVNDTDSNSIEHVLSETSST